MNRLELRVHSYNARAYKCYLNSGFKEEGRLRERFFINCKYYDIIILSVLKSEYEGKMQVQPII